MNVLNLSRKAWDNIGSKAAHNNISKKYSELFDLFCDKLPKQGKVLDFGCGPGIPFAKKLVEQGFEVTGVDISEAMIQEAKKNVPEAEFIRTSMTEVEFKQEFDGIFSGYSMLCLDPKNFKLAATKAVEALKPGGLFFLSLNEPSPEGHNEEEDYTELMGESAYSRPYTEKEIREIFEPLSMKVNIVERESISSPEYGDEHTLLVLMEKTGDF